MNVGHGLRALLGGFLAVWACLGMSCTEEKAAAAASVDTTGEHAAPLVGTPFQVKDIRTGVLPDNFFDPPTTFIELGDTVLFGATDKVHGKELWRTDGTAAGTSLVLDLVPGPAGSEPSHAVRMNGRVYFSAALTTYGWHGLWSTDGTAEGTVLVKALHTNVTFIEARDGVLYIGTGNTLGRYGTGFALWRSDGTTDGTVLLRTEPSAVGFSGILYRAWLGGSLLFAGQTADFGVALWKTDGTPEGTVLVKDHHPGYDDLAIIGLTPCGGQVFFWAESNFGVYSLWRTDGSEAGTHEVKHIDFADPAGSTRGYASRLACLGDAVYFSAWDAQAGSELWKSDGTAEGTVRVADLLPGSLGSKPFSLTPHKGALYFMADDPEAGIELWKSDGTAHGAARISDIAPGTADPLEGLEAFDLLSTPGGLFFLANDGVNGIELWKADGTPQGTVRMSNNTSTRYGFFRLYGVWAQDALYFWSSDDELWRSTGTAAGTQRLTPLAAYTAGGLFPWNDEAVAVGGKVFFAADDGTGERLWWSDGTSSGTVPVPGGVALHSPRQFTPFNGQLLVAANEESGDRFLWSVSPAGQPPRKLAPVQLWHDEDARPVTAGTRAFFVDWFYTPQSVWTTDGTTPGTLMLKHVEGRFPEWKPRLLTAVGARVFFAATAAPNHEELWTSDGTPEGTRRVTTLAASGQSVAFEHMLAMNGRLYFFASTGTWPLKRELWTSDGTAEGTRSLGTVASLSWKTPGPGNTAVAGGSLFFVVEPEAGPPELWKTDGSAPVKVRAFGTDVRTPPPGGFTPHGDLLLFWADDGVSGYQPWRSDGTEAGTVKVKDLRSGGLGAVAAPTRFVRLGQEGPALFAASDGLSGLELWKTNGTAAGTVRVADVVPGVASFSPGWMAATGQHVLFQGWSHASGIELWAAPWSEEDADPPRLTCPQAQVAEAVNAQGATVSYPPATATDSDPSPTVVYSHASGAVFALGATEVSVTATDDAGNAATCSFTVSVRDTVAPSLECPTARSAVATSEAGVAVTWPEAMASDAVSTAVTVTYAPANGSMFSVGTTEVTATATDASGNHRSCTFEVRVQAAPGGGTDAGTPDGGSGETDAGTSPPPPEDSSGCGCQQSGGAGVGMLGLALLGLLSTRRRRSVGDSVP
ncbi:ELWxxDGT repeat protein [Myxococcus sp. RHSTA-1-4]|uniref:ELWxxDGT repeat protein n=1 Tax=Myxococcus sp. RHSTA-1-4 TaxID=2874601 RepID=UPI001CBCF4FD|nr:ELWxxDGT repeat protein [Myxococcus sp. RHSTA-1-4]MBZ4417770.1 HYR domain-containing protein [Myxococcus sp. RHSTA-1-4]